VKKLLLVVVVVALALTLVPLALAGAPGGGGWKHGHAKFNLVGKVLSVDTSTASETTAGTIVIHFRAGTKTVRVLRCKENASFVVAAGARVWMLTDDGAVAKTLADVAAGDRVKARGVITKVDNGNGTTTFTYTIKNLKYHDLTPDEVTPPAQP
jgi:hypothetical protein